MFIYNYCSVHKMSRVKRVHTSRSGLLRCPRSDKNQRLISSHFRCRFRCSRWWKSVQWCYLIWVDVRGSHLVLAIRVLRILASALLGWVCCRGSGMRVLLCHCRRWEIRWDVADSARQSGPILPKFDRCIIAMWAASSPMLLVYTTCWGGEDFKAGLVDHYDG